MPSPRARRLSQNAALALLSCLAALGLIEIGLRLFWSDFYLKFRPEQPSGDTQFHPERGWALVPGIRVTQGDNEFTVTHTHNALGFRGPEVAAHKSPGRPRVLVLGDSMTYGRGVEDAETYPAVLAQREPGLEVIDAGVPGYSGVEELLLLREDGMRLAPDVVILGFFWNDVADAFHGRYARFELENGALRFVPPSPASPDHPAFRNKLRRRERRTGPIYSLVNHSYTWRFASDRLKLLHLMLDEWWHGPAENPGLDASEQEPAWQLSFALIREMRRVAEQGGARFLLLAIPDQVQVEQGTRVVGAPHYLYEVPQRLAGFARAEGIEMLDLLRELRTRCSDRDPCYYRFDRHWNARGHREAAELLDAKLRSLGWQGGRRSRPTRSEPEASEGGLPPGQPR
jgi:lysophospholipase L1-like esterase